VAILLVSQLLAPLAAGEQMHFAQGKRAAGTLLACGASAQASTALGAGQQPAIRHLVMQTVCLTAQLKTIEA